jgi:hypothetical protein
MHASDYPAGGFKRRPADLSVDHPRAVENYRTAHDIAIRDSQGQATTGDLRHGPLPSIVGRSARGASSGTPRGEEMIEPTLQLAASTATTTADIARPNSRDEQGRTDGPLSLFAEEESQDFRKRWEQARTEFVDARFGGESRSTGGNDQ